MHASCMAALVSSDVCKEKDCLSRLSPASVQPYFQQFCNIDHVPMFQASAKLEQCRLDCQRGTVPQY
jgi:hypothetical protein